MQNLFNYIVIALLGGILIAIVSCRRSNGGGDPVRNLSQGEQKDMTSTIRSFFDSQEWKYRQYMDEDSVESFMLGFNGLNEEIMFRVDVMPNRNMYHIIAQSKTVIPPSNIDAAIKAINGYNLRAQVVSGCVSEEGNIIFWMGRNTDDGSFSEEAFGCDFDMVMREADTATAQIFQEALAEGGLRGDPQSAYQ